jgi:NAD(P)-dependent dehydrogenase (short-subunit alcohol dehydrogenase family)/rhamnose utilization protein RhaD (predicted bifunctional aldolase and dehydrogenase)
MKQALDELVQISRRFGADPAYAIAGGGNTSWKDEKTLYVKASGSALGTIDAGGFVALDRKLLGEMSQKSYSQDVVLREQEVKSDLLKSRLYPEKNQRPSVEASVHHVIPFPFVVHLHPTLVNGLLCAQEGETRVREILGGEVLFLPYTTPGYVLYKAVESALANHHRDQGRYPRVILLQNHGVFVGADSAAEAESIYLEMDAALRNAISQELPSGLLRPDARLAAVLPAIRALVSAHGRKILRVRYSSLFRWYSESPERLKMLEGSFTPDGIVYCNPLPLALGPLADGSRYIDHVQCLLEEYRRDQGMEPRIVLIPGAGVLAVGDGPAEADTALDVYEDILRIGWYSRHFGGPKHMAAADVGFIVNWEVEAYRKSLLSRAGLGRMHSRVAVVTGGAQGFGKGIAEGLLREGACVVLADIDREKAAATRDELARSCYAGNVSVVHTNVGDSASIRSSVDEAILNFGGIDLLISNAGVLRAGGLDELEEEDFELLTRVNYTGFYLCTKYFSVCMRLQHRYNSGMLADIIQVNSKSGLQGSNRNFAYAGGKFGGIGLVQSFALELVGDGIKVNAVCPGNYFEGPLWSDPEKGLFRQYLETGKVPGARDISDVKKFYENKVPMGRGCSPSDVVKAILYLVEQEYETGQALPVTGGQVMMH